MLGRLQTLCASGIFWFVVVYFCSPLLLGFRAKHHRRGSFFSLHPQIICLPSGNMTVTSFFLNTTVHFTSQMVPIPISVLVNVGMMYHVVGKSAVNFGIGSVASAVDVATCPFSVPTLILVALMSSVPCGAFGAIYKCTDPESNIPVCSVRRLFSPSSGSLGIYVLRVGLQIKLASYIKFSLQGCLSTTVFSCPHMEFIVERFYFFFHKPFFPTLSVFVLSQVGVASVVSVRRRSSNRFTILASRKIVPSCPCNTIGT